MSKGVHSETFPPSARIRKSSEFRNILRRGRRRSTGCFTLYTVTGEGETRLGLIVSRKCGKAVERNRIKRRIREIFRRHRSEMTPGTDLVVQAKPALASVSYKELERLILDELGAENVWQPDQKDE